MAKRATKDLSVYFLRSHRIADEATPVVSSELWTEVLSSINDLPISLNEHQARRASRYFMKDGTYYGVLFYDLEKRGLNPETLNGNFIYGIAYKRRDVNWPFLENGAGAFDRIQTNTESDSLAEVTFFLLDKRRSVILYVANPRAASVNIFADYLSAQWRNAYGQREEQDNKAVPSRLDLRFLLHPDVDGEFTRMQVVNKVEIQLSGKDMLDSVAANLASDHNGTMSGLIRTGVRAARGYGGQRISFSLNVDLDEEEPTRRNELKRALKVLKNCVISFIAGDKPETRGSNAKSRCSISGRIDDATRTLDLLEDKLLVKTHMEFSGRYLDFGEVFDKLGEIYRREETLVALSIGEEVIE